MQEIREISTQGAWIHLAKHYINLPTDKHEVIFTCEVCGEEVEPLVYRVDDILHYKRAECPCVIATREQEKRRRDRLERLEMEYSALYGWLNGRFSSMPMRKRTFENFQIDRQPDAYRIVRMFASVLQGTLVLYGTFGTGKTHLLAAMCNEMLEKRNITAKFTTAPHLFGAIQQRIQGNEEYHSLVERCIRTPLLVIDDIDKAKHSDFREEVYFSIIDARTNAELPTAISTNRVDELANYVGGAVCSRLKVGQIAVEMSGRDYREEM